MSGQVNKLKPLPIHFGAATLHVRVSGRGRTMPVDATLVVIMQRRLHCVPSQFVFIPDSEETPCPSPYMAAL